MDELREVLRSYLTDRKDAAWPAFARELGLAGLTIPEEYGGAAQGPAEVSTVAGELGRALSPYPYLQTSVLAVEAIMRGSAEARARLLPAIADGSRTATVLLSPELSLDGDRLSGAVPYALDGDLVLAYVDGLLVEATPTRRTPYRTMDETRPLVELTFDHAPVRQAGTDAGRDRVRDLGIAALAAEQAGGAARCLELAVEHARRREQFGRPIGAFQAVKHRLAGMLLLVESARSAALAAWESPANAAIAGSYCSEAYLRVAGDAIQVFGGIGITWEHPAHRYFKRATSDAQLFGPPRAHRERLAAEQLFPGMAGVGGA